MIDTVNTDTEQIKRLDGSSVLCESNTCEEPALYLFVAKGGERSFAALCEEHALRRIHRTKLVLSAAG